MKWLWRSISGLLVILVLAVIGLWLIGQRHDRGYFSISIMINRPPSVVYAALTNEEITKKWVSGVIDLKKSPKGRTKVGTKMILTEEIDGNVVVMEEEITYLDPPNIVKYTARGMGDPATGFTELGEYILKPVDNQTEFTMTSKMEYHGFLYRLLEPVITPSVRKKFEGDQKTLKRLLEQIR